MDNAKQGSCFLCEALNRKNDTEAFVLFRGRHCCVIMNLYPYNNGHLLVVPYAHVPDTNSLSGDELHDLVQCMQQSVEILKRDMRPEGFNIGINIGKAAGAGLPDHLHMQIVPRWAGDTSFISVFNQTRVMPERLDETYKRLKPYFEKLKDG